jgi:ABC-type long-subunit fatty acid transport system fused permease/ATPase subunit
VARKSPCSREAATADHRTGSTVPHFDITSQERTMSLVTVVIVLIVVGVLLWLINAYIPMQPTIKSILNAVVIIVVVIWLLQAFGVLGEIGNVRIGN